MPPPGNKSDRTVSRPLTVIFGVAAAALACVSFVAAAGNAWRGRTPAAIALLPGETQAEVGMLDGLMLANKKVPAGRARTAARTAIKAQPLNTQALRLLMYTAKGPKLSPEKVKIAEIAGRVSRRDGLFRLVLFENAARNNLPIEALDNIDAILRVTPASQSQIFPLLKRLLVDADFRKHLRPYLVNRSPWSNEFVLFAANDKAAVGNVADVVIAAGKGMHAGDMDVIGTPLLTRTIEAREFDRVPALLSLVTKDGPALLNSERWTSSTVNPKYGLAAWTTASDATVATNFMDEGGGSDRKLSIYAASGAGGLAASKYLFLKPGTYQLSFDMSLGEENRPGQTAGWQLKCLSRTTNSTVWSSGDLLAAAKRSAKFSITVPPDCPHQLLELDVAVDFQANALEMVIDKFRLNQSASKPISVSDLQKPRPAASGDSQDINSKE